MLIPPSLKHSFLCFYETTLTSSSLAACLFPVQAHPALLTVECCISSTSKSPPPLPLHFPCGQIPLHPPGFGGHLQYLQATHKVGSPDQISSELWMGVYNCLHNTSIHSTPPQMIAPKPNAGSQCNGWRYRPPVPEVRNLGATSFSLGPYSWSHCYFSISPTLFLVQSYHLSPSYITSFLDQSLPPSSQLPLFLPSAPRVIFWKHIRSCHSIMSLSWLPIVLSIKNKILKVTHKALQSLTTVYLSILTFYLPPLTSACQ